MVLKLEELSWPRIENELEDGNTLIIVMAGSIEQHGPSLPLSVDTMRADEIGERIADELECVMAPTIRPGISAHHMAFPGTISFSKETFHQIVADYCQCLTTHGFEDIALITTHGGNRSTLKEAATELNEELNANIFMPGTDDSYFSTRNKAAASHDFTKEVAGPHAGAAETSFMLETAPDLVDQSQLTEGFIGSIDTDQLLEDGLDTVTKTGVLGDQRAATPAAGRAIRDATVMYYVDQIHAELRDTEAK